MSVITHYTAPLPYQNLALYHPISGPCVTSQERTRAQATGCWRERRTCPHQAHLGRSKSVQRESSYSCLDLADLPTDTHFDRERPEVKQADPNPDRNHPEIPWAQFCTTWRDPSMIPIQSYLGPKRVPELNTCHVPLYELLRLSSRELWGPF